MKESTKVLMTTVPRSGLTNVVNVVEGTGSSKARSVAHLDKNSWLSERTDYQLDFTTDTGVVTPQMTDTLQLIEKSHIFYRDVPDAPGNIRPQTCPSVHVGLQPVIALTTNSITNRYINQFTDSQAYFEVTCELTVKVGLPTERPHCNSYNTSMDKKIFKISNALYNGVEPDKNRSMFHGLYTY